MAGDTLGPTEVPKRMGEGADAQRTEGAGKHQGEHCSCTSLPQPSGGSMSLKMGAAIIVCTVAAAAAAYSVVLRLQQADMGWPRLTPTEKRLQLYSEVALYYSFYEDLANVRRESEGRVWRVRESGPVRIAVVALCSWVVSTHFRGFRHSNAYFDNELDVASCLWCGGAEALKGGVLIGRLRVPPSGLHHAPTRSVNLHNACGCMPAFPSCPAARLEPLPAP